MDAIWNPSLIQVHDDHNSILIRDILATFNGFGRIPIHHNHMVGGRCTELYTQVPDLQNGCCNQ